MKFLYSILTFSLLVLGCSEKKEMTKNLSLYIGTYTDGDSEGIYEVKFNPESGTLDSITLKAQLPNPSFLAVSNDKKFLYAIQETKDFDNVSGGITAFSLSDGNLKEINTVSVGGAHPCHVALSGDGQLAVSNYTGGNIAIYDVNEDGSLGDRQLIAHNPPDTTGIAHVHKALFNKDGLFVADLGLDKLKRYVKKDDGWSPAHQADLSLPEGAGPRHFEFSTNGNFLYVINELNSTITVFKRDDEGSFNPIQTESTLANDFKGESFCADIHLSQDGKFLYGSNRGENTIVIFSIDQEAGEISLVGRASVHGDWPRNFTLDPTGNFLLVANQRSSNISVYKRDPQSGTLDFLNEFAIPNPVCLLFLD